jgi:tetratricopeptide (TPR) repeat protein
VQTDERLEELIAKAQREYEAKPGDSAAVKNLVDLLCRRERDDEELKAIAVLVAEYKRSDVYRWKQLADDIRMKQLGRKARELGQKNDEAAAKDHQIQQLRFELSVFKERSEKYPTDNRIKFEYGVRNFKAGRFDEAIPLFQSARNDPKNRAACGLYLGRCFFRKGYPVEAIATLEEAVAGLEITDDDLAKNMLYWLGRALEEAGRISEARSTYGRLLQLDYNYKDVRARLGAMPSGSGSGDVRRAE